MSGCEEEERDYGNSWQKYQGRRKAICFLWRKSSFHLSHPLLPLPFSVSLSLLLLFICKFNFALF